jgi:hypothetical protein
MLSQHVRPREQTLPPSVDNTEEEMEWFDKGKEEEKWEEGPEPADLEQATFLAYYETSHQKKDIFVALEEMNTSIMDRVMEISRNTTMRRSLDASSGSPSGSAWWICWHRGRLRPPLAMLNGFP